MNNTKNHCPFINNTCREDCIFRTKSKIATGDGIFNCLIAAKLSDINEYQSDQLS